MHIGVCTYLFGGYQAGYDADVRSKEKLEPHDYDRHAGIADQLRPVVHQTDVNHCVGGAALFFTSSIRLLRTLGPHIGYQIQGYDSAEGQKYE